MKTLERGGGEEEKMREADTMKEGQELWVCLLFFFLDSVLYIGFSQLTSLYFSDLSWPLITFLCMYYLFIAVTITRHTQRERQEN